MFRKHQQKNYIIHQAKKSRSPSPRIFNQFNSNINDDSESDEEYLTKLNSKDTKNLHLEKVEEYALVDSSKNIRLRQNSNRLSHYIIKEDYKPSGKIYPFTNRSPLRNTVFLKNNNSNHVNHPKYSIKNPSRKSKNAKEHGELIYIRKKIRSDSVNNFKRLDDKNYKNSNQNIIYHDYYEEDIRNPFPEDEIVISTMADIDLYNTSAVKIQAIWRGYNLRHHLFQNLNMFYKTNRASLKLNEFLLIKLKGYFWLQFKRYTYERKKIYIKNTLNLVKIPRIYNKNELIIKFGTLVYRKELNESFQYIRKIDKNRAGSPKMCDTRNEKAAIYKAKYQEKVLKRLLILKQKRRNKSLRYYFDLFISKVTAVSKSNIGNNLKSTRKTHLLKNIVQSTHSSQYQTLKNTFLKFYLYGTLNHMKDSLAKSNNTINEMNKSNKLFKIVLAKSESNTVLLRNSFTNYINKIRQNKANDHLEKRRTFDINNKMRKIVISKAKDEINNLRQYFMKFYSKGIYKKLQSIPETSTNEVLKSTPNKTVPNIIVKKSTENNNDKDKWKNFSLLLYSKQRNKKEFLRHNFWKFYFGGVYHILKNSDEVNLLTKPKNLEEMPMPLLMIDDPQIMDSNQIQPVQSANPAIIKEKKIRMKQLHLNKIKANELKLRNAFTIYKLKCKFLKNQTLRETKLKSLVIKKDSDIHNKLMNNFTKLHLKLKLIRVKELLFEMEYDKKKILIKPGIGPFSQLKTMNLSCAVLNGFDHKDYHNYNNDDNIHDESTFNNPISTTDPSKLHMKRNVRIDEANKQSCTQGDIILSKDEMNIMIMKHIKLINIIDNKYQQFLKKYFDIWYNVNKKQNIPMTNYKAALFVKIISNWNGITNYSHLKSRFNQWENGGFNIKKKYRTTEITAMLHRIIKKFIYKRYFRQFFIGYRNFLQYNQLIKVINNKDVMTVRLQNKDLKNKFLTFANKQYGSASSTSINYFMDLLQNFIIMKEKKNFYTRLNQKVLEKKPSDIKLDVKQINDCLKRKVIIYRNKNNQILTNFLWRYQNPKKYYFRKYYARILKIKEKELEIQLRKWEFDDFNPINKKSSSVK